MKKLSFFLMAMLFSVMSFAAESLLVTLDFSKNTWGLPVGSANKTTATVNYTNGDYTITLAGGGSGHYYNNDGYLIFGKSGATLTLPAFDFKTTKIVVTGRTGASASVLQNIYVGATAVSTQTKGAAVTNTYAIAEDYQAAGNVYVLKVTSSHNTQIVKMEIYGEEGGEQGEKVDAPTFSVTETNFNKAFDLTISSAEGTTLKYTTDNTDPKTSETAVSVETNTANVAIPAKSTVVNAVAVKGDLVSVTSSIVYAYVNSAETAYTVAEAMEVIDAGLGLENELYVKGEISKIEKFDANYGSITYWIEDEEGNEFECYSGLGLNKAKFTKKEDLVVGSKVVVCGVMKKYKTIYEFDYNNYIVSLTLPSYTVTATAENGSVAGLAADGKYEHGAEATLTATAAEGYEFTCWTSGKDTVSTANPYKFTVTADVALVANFKEVEPEIEWMEMPLEITNLVTEVMEVEGAKYLQLAGRHDMNDADVTLFLNNYADVDDDYEVNAEYSYMTFGGMEFTVIEGVMTQTSETDKGTIYTGTVYASVTDEEEGGTMYVKFALTMYAAPATVLELTDAIVAINEELGTLTFNVPTGEGEGYYVELAGYTAPGVHEGPQICLLKTPEVVAYTNYAETSVVDGVITLTGEFTSFMGAKFDLTISGKLPGSGTALENIAVEGKAVKAIVNGQLIIIKNGVQYNAQGQVVK